MKKYSDDDIQKFADELSKDIIKTFFKSGYQISNDGGYSIKTIRKKVLTHLKKILQ